MTYLLFIFILCFALFYHFQTPNARTRGARKLQQTAQVAGGIISSTVLSGSTITGNAGAGVSTQNGKGNGAGGTSGVASGNGQATSPFLDTKSTATSANSGSGDTTASVDVADPAVIAGTITNGSVGSNLVIASNTQSAAQSGPVTGGGTLTAGSITAGGSTTGMGVTTNGQANGKVIGSGLGVGSTTSGRAGGDGVGAITGAAFSNGESNQATAPFTGTGGATATFSNGGSASFGQAAPTSAAFSPAGTRTARTGPLTAASIGVAPEPAVVGFQVKKEPTFQLGGF
jgi:hypothetical protein